MYPDPRLPDPMYPDPVSTGAMIALLPATTDWTMDKLPHMTLVYAGEIGELDPTTHNQLGKDAMSIGMSFPPQVLEVLGIETMGDEEKVDVLRLKPNKDLLAMRSAVEVWNASQHPYKPHVTIGPVGTVPRNIPKRVTFDRVYVGWGPTGSTYQLRP